MYFKLPDARCSSNVVQILRNTSQANNRNTRSNQLQNKLTLYWNRILFLQKSPWQRTAIGSFPVVMSLMKRIGFLASDSRLFTLSTWSWYFSKLSDLSAMLQDFSIPVTDSFFVLLSNLLILLVTDSRMKISLSWPLSSRSSVQLVSFVWAVSSKNLEGLTCFAM